MSIEASAMPGGRRFRPRDGSSTDDAALPRAYNAAVGGERAFLKWSAIVSAECAGCAVVVAQTGHEDFIRRFFTVIGFGVVCELERFPED